MNMTGIYLAQLIFGVFVVSHWAACSFYGVARFKVGREYSHIYQFC